MARKIVLMFTIAALLSGCGSLDPINPPSVAAQATTAVTYLRAQIANPIANPSDVACLTGSDSRDIQILQWDVTGYVESGAASGIEYGSIIIRSSPDMGGMPVILSGFAADQMDSPATSTAQFISAFASAPTLGNKTGLLSSSVISFPNAAMPAFPAMPSRILSSDYAGRPVTLHGSRQWACLNFAGAALPAGSQIINRLIWSETPRN